MRTDGQQKVLSSDSLRPQYRIPTAEYVVAEQIQWHFHPADSILDIVHFRKVSNCASQLAATCQVSGNTLYVEETNSATAAARCNCAFDLFCSMRMPTDVDSLILVDALSMTRKSWAINLADTSCTLIVDTASLISLGVALK